MTTEPPDVDCYTLPNGECVAETCQLHGPLDPLRPVTGPGADIEFISYRAVMAEGARIGLASCLSCGAAIVIDPSDEVDPKEIHRQWHEAHE